MLYTMKECRGALKLYYYTSEVYRCLQASFLVYLLSQAKYEPVLKPFRGCMSESWKW